jgi:hypothetical protein
MTPADAAREAIEAVWRIESPRCHRWSTNPWFGSDEGQKAARHAVEIGRNFWISGRGGSVTVVMLL